MATSSVAVLDGANSRVSGAAGGRKGRGGRRGAGSTGRGPQPCGTADGRLYVHGTATCAILTLPAGT